MWGTVGGGSSAAKQLDSGIVYECGGAGGQALRAALVLPGSPVV